MTNGRQKADVINDLCITPYLNRRPLLIHFRRRSVSQPRCFYQNPWDVATGLLLTLCLMYNLKIRSARAVFSYERSCSHAIELMPIANMNAA